MAKKKIVIIAAVIVAIVCIVILLVAFQNAPSPEATGISITETEPVDYTNHEIDYQYFDVINNTYQTEKVPVEDQGTLRSGLEVIAQNLFGKKLEETPMDPESINVQDGKLIVDFKPEIKESPLGSSGEAAMLDAISDLYLNNIEGVNAVYFGIDGGDFITAHTEQPRSEAYRTK